MIVESVFPYDLICVSDILGGYRVSRQYDGYTEDEARAEFYDEFSSYYETECTDDA